MHSPSTVSPYLILSVVVFIFSRRGLPIKHENWGYWIPTLTKIAGALGVDPAELVSGI
jgi:hypothetical protein